jgi:Flp pilus assembly protein TadG
MWRMIGNRTSTVRRRRDDESGAVAIMVGVLCVVLFAVAALGVDLGNAMNRKQLTQNSADFAALAGGNNLPDTGSNTVQAVADYLNENQPPSDDVLDCNPDAGDEITVGMLTDGNEINGEVTFPTGTTRIRVVSPAARVQFGLANVLGQNDACVQSTAVARIASGKIGMAPFYTTDSCDEGPQVLKSDAGGPSIPFSVPQLANDSDTNSSVLSNTTTPTNPTPNQILQAVDGAPDGPTVTITGTNLGAANITKVGFFNSDQTAPKETAPLTTPAQTATSVSVNVPNAVAKYQDVWWIRVFNGTTNKWSARGEARPLLVGDVTLSCDPESVAGNFGSIDLPWGGNDLADLEKNIADGLRPPTTLMPWPTSSLPADNTCDTMGAPAIISTDGLSKENTNCVLSVTGLKAKPTYDGFLKNSVGRLLQDTSQACQDRGRPLRGPYNENSDVLSCFLKDDTLKLSDTVNYNGPDSLFTQDLWKSPRFLLVPKLHHDPSGTKWMPIEGFVAAFITDQPTGASRPYPLVSTSTDNGLVVENPNKLRAIRVFFFSFEALPSPPDGVDLQDYIGSGKKIVTLVD